MFSLINLTEKSPFQVALLVAISFIILFISLLVTCLKQDVLYFSLFFNLVNIWMSVVFFSSTCVVKISSSIWITFFQQILIYTNFQILYNTIKICIEYVICVSSISGMLLLFFDLLEEKVQLTSKKFLCHGLNLR